MPVLKASPFCGNLAGSPEDLGGDRVTCRVPTVAGKEPLLRLASEAVPVDAQRIEQLRAEHDIAVLGSLASPDMNHHPLAVDVADLEVGCLCATCPSGIKRHQQDAVKRGICRVDQACHFLLAEHLRKVANLLRIGRLGDAPAALQHVDIEEPQSRQSQDDGVRAEPELGEQDCLILAYIPQAELIWPAMKVSAEVLNTVQVSADGGIGEVATPQLLKHELTQLVHRESSFSASQATPAVSNVGVRTRACVRRRGFVQVRVV